MSVLKRTIFLVFSSILFVLLSACASDSQMKSTGSDALNTAGSGALVGLLTSQLGVSNQQALGGAGAIFSAAQQNMSSADFGALTKAVPGIDSMLSAVPDIAGNSGGDLIGAAFSALGMDSAMVRQFMPIILGYVQNQGGNQVMGMLQKALL